MSDPWLPPISGVNLAAVAVGPIAHHDAPEGDQLPATAVPAKRATFIAGRRAARRALRQRWGVLPDELRISADEMGRPIVVAKELWNAGCVSISHAGGWAVAAVSDAPLGIDLVEIERFGPGFVDEMFRPDELAAAQGAFGDFADEVAVTCLAFAAKEAALKWLGVGLRVPARSVRVLPQGPLDGCHVRYGPVHVEHSNGRARLTLVVWPFGDCLWCVLIRASGLLHNPGRRQCGRGAPLRRPNARST